MLQIGLTGNIGSGKSTVALVFECLGIPVYRADVFARHIMHEKEVVEEVGRIFGEKYIDKNFQIDRKALAAEVFSHKEKLELLNKIIHPRVIQDYSRWVAQQTKPAYVMMESAILYEANLSGNFHKIILVTAPLELRLNRVIQRDHTSRADVMRRAANQLDQDYLLTRADFVIENNDLRPVIPQVLTIDAALRTLAS
ncbi:MAG TPA: dephospho-CoA kinase [Bacteroidales bacterium]|nr:dephospho-CoA kinase [Bacteroidales bacterium]